jgi:hypothetical protein
MDSSYEEGLFGLRDYMNHLSRFWLPVLSAIEKVKGVKPLPGDYRLLDSEILALARTMNPALMTLQTIECFYKDDLEKCPDSEISQNIQLNPEKIRGLNEMIALLNNSINVTIFKRAWNQLIRIIYGETAYRKFLMDSTLHGKTIFPEPEFNPDLL